MQNPASCCPGRPAHSRSRAFFQAAATLALIAGGVSGSLSTQARADYLNPLGNTTSSGFTQTAASVSSVVNNGTINTGVYGIVNWPGSSITTVANAGTMNIPAYAIANFESSMGTLTNSGTINGGTYAIANFSATGTATIGSFVNSGTINASNAFAFANFGGSTITSFTNSGTISSANVAVGNDDSTITTFTNSGTLSGGAGPAIRNSGTGTIGTMNLLSGSTITGSIFNSGTIGSFNADNAGTISSFINDGTVNNVSGNGLSLYTSSITTLTNNGTIAGDWVILLNLNSSITTLNNNGNITGATDGINNQGSSGNVNTITTLNNSGTISGASRFGVTNSSVITTLNNSGTIAGHNCGIVNWGTIGTLNNSGTITGNGGETISNQGTIGTLNLLSGSVLNGQISNYGGTIGTLNIYKTVTSGNFDSSSITATVFGNQPGTTNRYATVNNGTTVGTFTNSVSLNTLTNAGTITTLSNSSTIGTLTNSGTIGTLNLLSGSSITNSILNSGSIGTLNFHQTVTNGNFNTSSLVASISGNQPGTTNLHATVNSGTTVGTFTNAISLNTLTNGGTITTLTNSGTIGSITNTGTIGTLNLLSGSTVTSGINNSGTINILNMTITGVTCGNYDVSVPGITGNQPITVNISGLPTDGHSYSVTRNGRRASVDVSGFGANTNAVRQVSNSVSRLANTNRLIESIGAKAAKVAAEPYAMTSDLCADGATAPAQFGNSDFWIRGFTGRNKVDASASSSDYINTYSGGAVGIDRDWSDDVRGGFFIGSGNMNNSLGGGLGGTETDLIFAGTYATKTWGTLFAKVGLTGGRGNNTGTRNIAAGAPEIATADYNSLYVSPEVSVGKVYALGQYLGGDFSVTPMLSVRYVYAKQEGYTETGATNNLTMNRSHSTTLEERAELKFSYATRAFNETGVKVNASVGGIGQQNNGGAMSGTLLGAPLSFATPGDDNSTGFVGGLGFEINRGKYTFTASGDYVRLSGGNADLSANVVFSVKF